MRLLSEDEYDRLPNSRAQTDTAGPVEGETVAASEPQSSESAADQQQPASAHMTNAAPEEEIHANELQQAPKSITLPEESLRPPGAPQAALPNKICSGCLSLPENLLTVPYMEATR